MALSSPGGPWDCVWRCTEVSTSSYLLNWIYLATLSSPRIVWFPAGNACLWKLQWGNSFFTSAQENEFNIVWRWDSSPGGGTEHLMSLGTNQKNSRGCIPIPPHLGTIKKVCLDVCLSELPIYTEFYLCTILYMYNSDMETHLATLYALYIVKGVWFCSLGCILFKYSLIHYPLGMHFYLLCPALGTLSESNLYPQSYTNTHTQRHTFTETVST